MRFHASPRNRRRGRKARQHTHRTNLSSQLRSTQRRLHLERLEERSLLAASTINIFAAGATGEETLELRIDGTTVATFNNIGGDADARIFQTLTYTHPTSVTPDQIEIAFTNDGVSADGADINLRIDGFTLDGQKYESEHSSVFSIGSWRASDGCDPGYKQSEWLHCDGSLSFQTIEPPTGSEIQIFAAGATGEETLELRIDGNTVATFNNIGGDPDARQFQTLSYTHTTTVTLDQVQLAFTNNGVSTGGEDINLRIDGFTLDGQKYESEDPSVLSVGSWRASDSCDPGYKQSEWLHCNGSFSFQPIEPPTGSEIQIFAAGATGEETLELRIDGNTVATFNNIGGDPDARQFQTLSYTHTTTVTPDQVQLAFTNNGVSTGGEDINLRIDGFTLDGQKYESEDPSVLSVGSWRASDSCDPGYKQSEWLHCNGSFSFQPVEPPAETEIQVFAAGETGEEIIELQIDAATVATFNLIDGDAVTGDYRVYSYESPVAVTADQVRVAFVNNGVSAIGGDRNVRIDGIQIGTEFWESEALSTYSTGTYIPGVGISPGHWESEWLYGNGYFEFDSPFDPGTLALGATTISVNEQDGTATIPVIRSGGTDGTVGLHYTTVNGSATAGNDFVATAGYAIFVPGQTTAFITIPLIDDDIDEGTETFSVTTDQAIGGAITGQPRTAVITVLDDSGAPTPGNGNGLLGAYYDDSNLSDFVFERTDATVNFDWGPGSPDPSIESDTFSVAWLGQIEPLYTETYTFEVQIDDGARLWIDDQLIIDQWLNPDPNDSGQISLQGGLRYDIRLEYYEDGNDARVELRWSSASQSLQIVPQSQLYSDPPSNIEGSFSGETLVSGLDQPVALDFASDGTMFIAQKPGVVGVYQNGSLLSEPFIDISAEVNSAQDRGLLGIAVHPDFPDTPYVYLLYTYDPPETASHAGLAGPDGNGNRVSRLVRYTADANTGYTTAVAGSGEVILGTKSLWDNISHPELDSTNDISLPQSCPVDGTLEDCIPSDSLSHSVGTLEFGTDGSLFVSIGDGTSFGQIDPRTARVQDIDSLSGKVLRIDPLTGEGLPDNPFYDGDANANRSKVYSYGLRNPFRLAIRPTDGEPYISDVGWYTWEEINTGRGANFGWPWYEGGTGESLQTGGYNSLPEAQEFYATNPDVTAPLFSRPHASGGVAIVAGDFYTGTDFPDVLQGALLFTDYGEPTLRALRFDPDGSFRQAISLGTSVGIVVEMTMGPDGYMYYADITGAVGRLQYTPPAAITSLTSIESVSARADFDGDGDVDGRDFLAWQTGFATGNASKTDGDATGDTFVDAADLEIWQEGFGSELQTGVSAQLAVEDSDVSAVDGAVPTSAGDYWLELAAPPATMTVDLVVVDSQIADEQVPVSVVNGSTPGNTEQESAQPVSTVHEDQEQDVVDEVFDQWDGLEVLAMASI